METVDEVILDHTLHFIDKSKSDGKPFFIWMNPTRMHVFTHLSPKYEAMRNSENGWTNEEAGMTQLDDIVVGVMQKLKDSSLEDNTIVIFTTDNGAENFSWPDGGQTPFAGGKLFACLPQAGDESLFDRQRLEKRRLSSSGAPSATKDLNPRVLSHNYQYHHL